VVPPGYYIKLLSASSGSLVKCPINITAGGVTQGYFRAGWKSYKDPSVQDPGDGIAACTPCGENIVSALTDIDEMNSGDDPTKLVAGSAASCCKWFQNCVHQKLVALLFNALIPLP